MANVFEITQQPAYSWYVLDGLLFTVASSTIGAASQGIMKNVPFIGSEVRNILSRRTVHQLRCQDLVTSNHISSLLCRLSYVLYSLSYVLYPVSSDRCPLSSLSVSIVRRPSIAIYRLPSTLCPPSSVLYELFSAFCTL